MYVDQVVIPGKIPDRMYPAIVTRYNVELRLVLKLSHCACMCPRLLCFVGEMLTFVWWDSTNSALPHTLNPCNHDLFFVVYHKSSDNRKAVSDIAICAEKSDPFLGRSLYR